ncbi:MAG: diphthamide biosynthesis enzyme Dph2, partial [archaeon]
GIQIPEGLKQYSEIILELFKENEPILFVDPCYGACDSKDKVAKDLGCKLLVHFGHYKMNIPVIETIYIPISYELSKTELDFIVSEIKKLKLNKINLVTTIQYLENIKTIIELLLKENIIVVESKESLRVKKHMILGCDASTIINQTEPIIFIGDGVFHANNLGFINNGQDVIVISPISKSVQKIEITDTFLRKRYAAIGICKHANKFGILVSTKQGQIRLAIARNIKKKLEENGKKAYILVSDYVKQEYLEGIKVDCYVNTACPRLVYDDGTIAFKKPVISVTEVDLLFDEDKELKVDQITSDI